MNQKCDQCGETFAFGPQSLRAAQENGVEAVYVECPHCKKKNLTVVLDDKARSISERYRKKDYSVMIAKQKRFREKTILGLSKERDALMKEYKEHQEELKPIGEEILKNLEKGGGTDGEEHNPSQQG